MTNELSCGMTPGEIEAEVAEAERETREAKAQQELAQKAQLAAMNRHARYNQTRLAKKRFDQATRRARALGAVPPHQTEDERKRILAVYEGAEAWAKLTGVPHEVDHIVPLEAECAYTGSRIASGLHIASNLRAIPASMNKRRGNRYYGGFRPTTDDSDAEIPF